LLYLLLLLANFPGQLILLVIIELVLVVGVWDVLDLLGTGVEVIIEGLRICILISDTYFLFVAIRLMGSIMLLIGLEVVGFTGIVVLVVLSEKLVHHLF
jgi:hypothetical protein